MLSNLKPKPSLQALSYQSALFDEEPPLFQTPKQLLVGDRRLTTTPVYDSYWFLAYERQEMMFKRLHGIRAPWTQDPILRRHKFTNAYRAADRTSQYLIREVIYRPGLLSTPREVFFRILLFKLFNKIETWQLLERTFGSITLADYRFDQYDQALQGALDAGKQIYSAAYMMPPGRSFFGYARKHQNHLRLLEKMISEDLPQRVADADSMASAFALVRSYPTIGDFLAYQYVTDLNYSELTDFSEQEFVMAGPGARDGIRKCFLHSDGLTDAELIRAVMERQDQEFEERGLPFRTLWGRSLQLIDCQNLFCEVSKYARVRHPEIVGCSSRTRIKQLFKPTTSNTSLTYFFPPKWGINAGR
jgi:alpha-glutamyl/putrescinyl thymine pyrophosphorylase clade 1